MKYFLKRKFGINGVHRLNVTNEYEEKKINIINEIFAYKIRGNKTK